MVLVFNQLDRPARSAFQVAQEWRDRLKSGAVFGSRSASVYNSQLYSGEAGKSRCTRMVLVRLLADILHSDRLNSIATHWILIVLVSGLVLAVMADSLWLWLVLLT